MFHTVNYVRIGHVETNMLNALIETRVMLSTNLSDQLVDFDPELNWHRFLVRELSTTEEMPDEYTSSLTYYVVKRVFRDVSKVMTATFTRVQRNTRGMNMMLLLRETPMLDSKTFKPIGLGRKSTRVDNQFSNTKQTL